MAHTFNTSSNYKQFKLLVDNRDTVRKHINKLKDAIQQNPEILEVQPILVNEKMEIIDGQHRFVAAMELNLPIHYTQVRGLDIVTARNMNILQKGWTFEDYAMSYAKAGNVHYKAFNKFHREYPSVAFSTVALIMSGQNHKNVTSDFRSGKFVMLAEADDVQWKLDELVRIRNLVGGVPISRAFVSALMKVLDMEDFNYERFITNLEKKPEMFERTPLVRDALRMIEDIYNYNFGEASRVRLY